MRLPGASISCSGITLSDEEGQGERARTRRYGAGIGTLASFAGAHENGRSVLD
jgi:hypothetical protein